MFVGPAILFASILANWFAIWLVIWLPCIWLAVGFPPLIWANTWRHSSILRIASANSEGFAEFIWTAFWTTFVRDYNDVIFLWNFTIIYDILTLEKRLGMKKLRTDYQRLRYACWVLIDFRIRVKRRKRVKNNSKNRQKWFWWRWRFGNSHRIRDIGISAL